MKRPDFKAVIFDLDGLVLDTEPTYLQAWQTAAEAMGYALPHGFLQSLSGLHGQAVEQALLAHCGQLFDLQAFYRLSSEHWWAFVQKHGIAQKSGFAPLIARLEQWRIPFCLATNSLAANARACLALAGLATTFSIIISRDDVKHGKPAPAIFLKAAQALDCPVGQCLVLEDSLIGVAAAQAAGAVTVFVPSTLSLAEARRVENVIVLADLHQVAEFLFPPF